MGRSYDYIKSNEWEPSLPCPTEGCSCGILSNFFDSYNYETKRKWLTNKYDNNILCDEVSSKWDDWDLHKVTKQSLKKCVTLDFEKYMHVTESCMTKLLSHEMKQLVKVHTVNMLPKRWQTFVINKIREKRLQFRKDEKNVL